MIDDVSEFVAAAEILKERGAYKIYIMATHGLLSAEAPRLIEESAIDEVKKNSGFSVLATVGVFFFSISFFCFFCGSILRCSLSALRSNNMPFFCQLS